MPAEYDLAYSGAVHDHSVSGGPFCDHLGRARPRAARRVSARLRGLNRSVQAGYRRAARVADVAPDFVAGDEAVDDSRRTHGLTALGTSRGCRRFAVVVAHEPAWKIWPPAVRVPGASCPPAAQCRRPPAVPPGLPCCVSLVLAAARPSPDGDVRGSASRLSSHQMPDPNGASAKDRTFRVGGMAAMRRMPYGTVG